MNNPSLNIKSDHLHYFKGGHWVCCQLQRRVEGPPAPSERASGGLWEGQFSIFNWWKLCISDQLNSWLPPTWRWPWASLLAFRSSCTLPRYSFSQSHWLHSWEYSNPSHNVKVTIGPAVHLGCRGSLNYFDVIFQRQVFALSNMYLWSQCQ